MTEEIKDTVPMPDLPPSFEHLQSNESKLFGVTVRALGFLIIVGTVCAMSALGREVKEPLYSLVLLSSGFYFGAKTSNMVRK